MGSCLSCRRWTSKRKLSNPPRDGIASAIGSGSRKPHKDSEALKKDKKLQKLIEYSGAHPEEISGIGAYLLQHLNRDLDKGNFTRVEVAVNIMDLLLESCRSASSWALLVENCLQMVKRLLGSGDQQQVQGPQLEELGINLFLRHAKLHREASNMCQMYNQLAPRFMDYMAKPNTESRRLSGFNSMKAVGFNALQLIPNSSNSHWGADMLSKVITSILAEMFEETVEDIENDEEDEGIAQEDAQMDFNTLFVGFLRELAQQSSVKNGQINFVLGPILKYFTMMSKWKMPNEFATTFFLSVLAGSGESKMEIFLQILIKHMGSAQKSVSTSELLGMATVLANFAPLTIRKYANDGQMKGVQKQNFMNTLELVQNSMELNSYRKDRELVGEYQDKLLEAMNKIASGLPESLKLQAIISGGSPMPIIIAEKPFFNPPPPPPLDLMDLE